MYIFNGYHGFGQAGTPLTEEQLGILGRCPNTTMPCRDFKTGEDLWQKVAFLDEGQKYTVGRCPNTQMPCTHPPGDPNGIDLWQLIKSKQQPAAPAAPGEKQICQGTKPASGPDFYYHCCPSGWTKTAYGDTMPCKGTDRGLEICGALPPGATKEDAVCCENLKEWYPKLPGGGNPCADAARASGRAVPNMPETMLAPDIIAPSSGGDNTTMLLAFGAVFVLLTGLTLWLKFK